MSKGDLGRAHSPDIFRGPAISVDVLLFQFDLHQILGKTLQTNLVEKPRPCAIPLNAITSDAM